MALGFWARAQENPDWIAVVDPDGTEHRAGDLLARANQLTRALRDIGLVRSQIETAVHGFMTAPDLARV